MPFLYHQGISHPIRVLLVALVVTAAAAPGLARLRLRTDGHALVPAGAEAVRHDAQVRADFGIDDLMVVLVRSRHAEGIYNPATLHLLVDLTGAIMQLDGVPPENVTSLATEKGDRFRPGTLDYYGLLEPFPDSPLELARLRNDLAALRIHIGALVSDDGTAAAIHVGVPAGTDRVDLHARIRRLADAAETEQDRIDVIGAPVAESLLGSQILDDLGVPGWILGGASRPFERADRPLGARPSLVGAVGLMPLALVVMAAVFLVTFRSLAALAIPLLEVGACLLVTFALMGWVGSPVYLTTAVLPVILTSIGVADEIHILSRYRQRLRGGAAADRAAQVRATLEEIAGPVVKTSLTTAAAFCAFALSPIAAVRSFGLFAAVGIVLCMVWSLAVTPAMLVLFGPGHFGRRPAGAALDRAGAGTPWTARVAGAAAGRPRLVLALAALLAAAAVPGVRRLAVQDSWVSGFDPASRFREATSWFNEHFFGAHILLVCVEGEKRELAFEAAADAVGDHAVIMPEALVADPATLAGSRIRLTRAADSPPPPAGVPTAPFWAAWIEDARPTTGGVRVTWRLSSGSPRIALPLAAGSGALCTITTRPLLVPRVMRAVSDLESFLETQRDCAVGGVLGPAAYLSTTNFIVRQRDPEARTIPDSAERIHWLWTQFARIRGERNTRRILDADFARGVVTVFLEDANFRDTARLLERARVYEREHLAPLGLRLSFAGDVAVSQTLIAAIVSTQVRSLLLSLAVIVAITAVLGRSFRFGALSALPCAAAILLNFAFMGAAGIPLGVATSMFAGMILGVGVDYAIHLLDRYRRDRDAGAGVREAIEGAAAVAGPAIAVDALVVALGFGVLALSQVPANARLGLLVMLCIGVCYGATMVLLPALLALGGGERVRERIRDEPPAHREGGNGG